MNSEQKEQNPVDFDLKEWDITYSSVREVLGLRYYTETQPIRDCIIEIIEENQCGPLEAGCALLETMAHDARFSSHDMLQAMAVTYELYTDPAQDPEDLGLVPAASGANNAILSTHDAERDRSEQARESVDPAD